MSKYRIPIVSLSAVAILALAFLMPVFPVDQYDNCSTSQIKCQEITVYAPLYRMLLCQVNCFGDSVSTITPFWVNLSAGSASSLQMRGTASLTAVIANPSSTRTSISSVTLTPSGSNSSSFTIYQCPSFDLCEAVGNSSLSIILNANQVGLFNSTTSAFYVSSYIGLNQDYQYMISFANGQSVSGNLIATNGP